MSTDILDAIDAAVAEHEKCPCGRPIRSDGHSFYWCREACQRVWNTNQEAPLSPEDFRAEADRVHLAGTALRVPQGGLPASPPPPAAGPPPVRERPSGVFAGALRHAEEMRDAQQFMYRRWCGNCGDYQLPEERDGRRGELNHATQEMFVHDVRIQVCARCQHPWPGRPLTGTLTRIYDPVAVQMRLSDGHRSTTYMVSPLQLERWRAPAQIMAHLWLELEQNLFDGRTDREMQERPARGDQAYGRGRIWDWQVGFPVLPPPDPNGNVRVTGIGPS